MKHMVYPHVRCSLCDLEVKLAVQQLLGFFLIKNKGKINLQLNEKVQWDEYWKQKRKLPARTKNFQSFWEYCARKVQCYKLDFWLVAKTDLLHGLSMLPDSNLWAR